MSLAGESNSDVDQYSASGNLYITQTIEHQWHNAIMKAAFSKLKLTDKSKADLPPKPVPILTSDYVLQPRDIYRYRKQYGVNIGAWFIGEKWISHELYTCCPEGKQSELSAVTAHLATYGLEQTKAAWEAHWDEWITESDLKYLLKKGINSIRLPIGWFSLSQEALTIGTDFEPVMAVYADCWPRIIKFIQLCATLRIGVLIDLHCLPGGANPDSHSGTDSGKQAFFASSKLRARGFDCVKFLIDETKSLDNVVGIQVVNEAAWGTEEKAGQFYGQCTSYSARYGSCMPIYISDCWNLEYWASWVSSLGPDEVAVIDHHYYHCFSPADEKRNVRDHTRDLMGDQKQLEARVEQCGAGTIVIGEWSCALPPASKKDHTRSDLRTEMKKFGREQNEIYNGVATGGSWFWTYKFQVRNHENEWDLRDVFEMNLLPSPITPALRVPDHEELIRLRDSRYDDHCRYWDSKGSQFEHTRYLDGWNQCAADCTAFTFTHSRLGFSARLLKNRLRGHVKEKGQSRLNCEWEYEAGYKQCLISYYS